MRIAIVGAGALGRIYGAHLASRHEVSWVVRPSRVLEAGPIVIEHAVPFGLARADVRPRRVAEVPDDADVAIVTLRFDTIAAPDEDLRRALRAAPGTLVVCLSPVFAAQRRVLEELVGHGVVAAMPGVSGYLDERGIVRYWAPDVVSTLIDDGGRERPGDEPPTSPAIDRRAELARALDEVGLASRLAPDVESIDAATTTSFFPLIAAVAVGHGLRGLAVDRALLGLVRGALAECRVLAAALGDPAAWASLLARAAHPVLLRAGLAVAARVAPEPVHFVDAHFGPKLRDQHLLMGEHLVALAAEHGIEAPALGALVERVRAS